MRIQLPCGEQCRNNTLLTSFATEVTSKEETTRETYPDLAAGKVACSGIIESSSFNDFCTAELLPPSCPSNPRAAAESCPVTHVDAVPGFRSLDVGPLETA